MTAHVSPPSLDIDTDALGRLLLRLESDAHRGGWDGAPGLFVLYDSRDVDTDQTYRHAMGRYGGLATRCGPYAAQSFAPAGALDGFPQHGLFRMAVNMSAGGHPFIEAILEVLRRPGFVGAAFLCESWQRETDDEGERESWRGKRFADMPGSQEVRMVNAADVGGRDYVVRRVRGDKPKLWASGDPGLGDIGGAVSSSLRMIAAVVGGLPRPELKTTPSMWSWDDQQTPPAPAS